MVSDYGRDCLPIPAAPSLGLSDLVAKWQEQKTKDKIILRPKKINSRDGK